MKYIGLFLLGAMAYTFVEYAVHRWLLHGPMKKQHRAHHRNPNTDIRTPFLIVGPVVLLTMVALGPAFAVGMFACWYGSAFLHRKLHNGQLPNLWMRKLHRHHIGHHRKASSNFGVTSVVWDKLFGTHRK